MRTYRVTRRHTGEKDYEEGDERTANPADVAHLVESGIPRADQGQGRAVAAQQGRARPEEQGRLMRAPVLVTAPSATPVSLVEANAGLILRLPTPTQQPEARHRSQEQAASGGQRHRS